MPNPAVAVVGASVIGGVASSRAQSKAASAAAGAQTEASQASIAEQQRQFDMIQELMRPYVTAGTEAVGQQQALLGLGGAGAQQQAIEAISQSPQYQALVGSGERAILQNAAATGGLRSGNTQAALAQFRPQILAQLIESQYGRLGGMAGLGQASAANQAAAAQQMGTNVSGLLGQAGAAQAGAALGRGQAQANLWGNISNAVGQYFGGKF